MNFSEIITVLKDGQEDPSEMSMESRRGRQDRRGGGVKRLRAGQDDGQAVHSTLASMRALSRDRVFTIGISCFFFNGYSKVIL